MCSPAAGALARLLAPTSPRRTHDRLEKAMASCLAAACLGCSSCSPCTSWTHVSAWLTTLLLAVGSGLCSTVGSAVAAWRCHLLDAAGAAGRVPHLAAAGGWRRAASGHGAGDDVRLPAVLGRSDPAVWFVDALCPPRLLVALLARWPMRRGRGTTIRSTAPLGPSVASERFSWRWRETLVPCSSSRSRLARFISRGSCWVWRCSAAGAPSGRVEPGDPPPGWRWVCVRPLCSHLALIASWNCWWGGDCWGSRLPTETVPFSLCFVCIRSPPCAASAGGGAAAGDGVRAAFVQLTGVYLKADYQAVQPGLFTHRPESPGSWENLTVSEAVRHS